MLPPKASRITAPERRVVLGLDPSVAAYGWAIVELGAGTPRVVAAGCIATSFDAERDDYVFEQDGDRIDELARALLQIIEHARTVGRVTVAFEAMGGSQSSRALKMLSFAFAITRSVCVATRAQSVGLRAAEVKLVMTGDRDAEKHVVAGAVEKAIGWTSSAKSKVVREAETDAVAVALVGARKVVR